MSFLSGFLLFLGSLDSISIALEEEAGYNGFGVQISSGATVYDNQSFLLTALGLNPDNRLKNYGGYDGGITVLIP